jgi:hypothetical protein
MIVVYVHGNGNKVRKDLLKRQWDQALFGRDAGDASRMAYWAPLLHPSPLPDPAFDEIELPAETMAEAPMSGGELESYVREMTYTAEAVVDGEQREEEWTEVVPLPRAARIALFRRVVEVTFKDVHAYFFRDYAERMRAVVREAIAGIEEPFVMVAHSLGTIIAYDVLREEAHRSLDLPLLVTVGSPLGVQEIQDLITTPLEVPAGVQSWLNASDLRDVVALDHTLKPEYDPPDRCTDITVTNGSANHHGIREYLAAPAVRDAIHAVLSGDAGLEALEAPARPSDEELNRRHRNLLDRLRPVLCYDSRDRYFADSAATFVQNRFEAGPMSAYRTRLRRADRTVIATAGEALDLDFLGSDRYGDGQVVKDDDRLDPGPEPVADARRMRTEGQLADVVYGRVAPRHGGGVWLQFWLFYFHSAKGIPGIQAADGLLGAGLHQGDWELLQLGIPRDRLDDAEPEPDVAILAAHDYAHRIDWEQVDRDEDGAWCAYVARGSHASYPKKGRWKPKRRGPFSFEVLGDVADGRGERRRPRLEVIRVGEPGWVGWPGLWGSTDSKPIVGGGSPRGPWRQRPWRDPDGFATDAIPWERHHVVPEEGALEAVAAAPAAPTVSVGRNGADWTITVAMPAGTEDGWVGTLTLASSDLGAAGRSLWLYDVTRPGPAPAVGEGES